MNSADARRIIEALRKGIPPDDYVRHFTVGRQHEIDRLTHRLRKGEPIARLLVANYGSGKTHLLRFVREAALGEGFAVSFISLDAKSAVKFSRMDQIFAAVLKHIELPNFPIRGPAALFGALGVAMDLPSASDESKRMLLKLSDDGKWNYSAVLKSPALFVALRAWIISSQHYEEFPILPQEVVGWITEPWNYYANTKGVYDQFVWKLRKYFHDPRTEWQFYRRGADTFILKAADFGQAWHALNDLNLLSKLSGYRGLVILVDEFEDVIYGLTGRAQIDALWNLRKLFGGEFGGFSFYAVTPGFVQKFKTQLQKKAFQDFDYSILDRLRKIEMSPLRTEDLFEIAQKIRETHGIAYGWKPDSSLDDTVLKNLVEIVSTTRIEDRTRITITVIVNLLDQLLEQDS